MELTTAVIGVDVGGTNTDAVILAPKTYDEKCATIKPNIIGKAKTSTTFDVTTGVKAAIHLALIDSRERNRALALKQVNIGTTHFVNAVVQGKDLEKVAVIRLCGTASRKILPFADIPENISHAIKGSIFLVNGGYQFDGSEITEVQEEEILKCVETLKERKEKNIVVSGIFSPLREDQENRVAEIIQSKYPEVSLTLSHAIGKVGMLERENAAILNESIKPLCLATIKGFRTALDDLGLKCPMYFTQNDGTIISEEKATKYPVLTFASGVTNSMRGAAFLSGVKDAIVIDIGGTSTDVGLLLKGFPREASAEVKIGGVRTNFRMPDVVSIGLGGGSYVSTVATGGKSCIKVGPLSAGYQIETEGLVFAKPDDELSAKSVTATDIAVAGGFADVGNKGNVKHLKESLVSEATHTIYDMITACIDQMRFSDRKVPMILAGGGSIIVNKKWKFEGITEMISPDHFDVANAVGAALSQISSSVDKVFDLGKYCNNTPSEPVGEQSRKAQLQKARNTVLNEATETVREELCQAGAVEDSITLVEKEDLALTYIPGDATRIKIKMVGDLRAGKVFDQFKVPDYVYTSAPVMGPQQHKQAVSTAGSVLTEDKSIKVQPPNIDPATGEWIVSEYDIECLSIGAGILGCGGGGSPRVARLLALAALKDGKKMKIVNPSRFLKDTDPENDLVTPVAFMGAPLILYEKLVSGNETLGALQCIQDLYSQGNFKDGNLQNAAGVEIVEKEGLRYIKDYQRAESSDGSTSIGSKKIVAIMSGEIGGMNCIEPLIVAAELGLPILDCDGMGRAFPELQMFSPFIYGCKPYPSALADDKGQRVATLYADGPKTLENHFREFVVSMGCGGGVVLSHFNKKEVLSTTVLHSVSRAWRIGNEVIKARSENRPAVKAVAEIEQGKLLINAKVTDVQRETTGGFSKGKLVLEGIDDFAGKSVEIHFQNEFLLAREVESEKVLTCVPDLVTLMDIDTAQPIPTEEVRFGIRVSVVGMRASPVITTDVALQVVGPEAFGYPDVVYTPVGDYVDHDPVAPM